MKKLLGSLVVLFGISLVFLHDVPSVSAKEQKATVAVFVREGCAHCNDEKAFLKTLLSQRSDVRVVYYQLEKKTGYAAWNDFTKRNKLSKVTPITVIGNQYSIGFATAETTGKEIEATIDTVKKKGTVTDITNPFLTMGRKTSTCSEDKNVLCTLQENKTSYIMTLPFLGTIETAVYPLFLLSAVLGFIDGFNPCAMWVLVTFLLLLLQVGNRKKILFFAGTFIVAEALMYTLILTVWFQTWDFVQLDSIVTPLVGVVALGSGIFFLYEYRKKEIACAVTNIQQRSKIKKQIEGLAFGKFTIVTFFGILAVAFSVNIIEFACSLGIPQAFTKILELQHLSLLQSGWYIFIYIFFYMLDDIVVFALAFYGAEKLSLTTTYSRYASLIGGIIMLLLGMLLLLKPSMLLF